MGGREQISRRAYGTRAEGAAGGEGGEDVHDVIRAARAVGRPVATDVVHDTVDLDAYVSPGGQGTHVGELRGMGTRERRVAASRWRAGLERGDEGRQTHSNVHWLLGICPVKLRECGLGEEPVGRLRMWVRPPRAQARASAQLVHTGDTHAGTRPGARLGHVAPGPATRRRVRANTDGGTSGTHREILLQVGRLELPQVAAREELAGEDDEHRRVEEELEQAQAAHLDLLGRVGLLRTHLFAAGEFLFTLLFALQPLLMGFLAFGAVLCVPVRDA